MWGFSFDDENDKEVKNAKFDDVIGDQFFRVALLLACQPIEGHQFIHSSKYPHGCGAFILVSV